MRFRATPPSDLAARVEATLATLPSHQRGVFLAIRDEGVSYGVLAERMGLSRDEVEQAFTEALAALDRATERPAHHHAIGAILTLIASALGLSRR